MLEKDKKQALADYNKAREEYLKNRSNGNWVRFCDAKRNCMMLGVLI
jgi:hypothetical protein